MNSDTPKDASPTEAFLPSIPAGSAARSQPASWTSYLPSQGKSEPPPISMTGDPKPGFRRTKLGDADLVKLVSSTPELTRLGTEVRLFTTGDANAIGQRKRELDPKSVFAPEPVFWSPDGRTEILAVTGHSKQSSFVLAYYVLPDGGYRLASSFVFINDVSPVVLAYDSTRRKELFWTSCWGCAGDGGGISFREDRRVVIVQH